MSEDIVTTRDIEHLKETMEDGFARMERKQDEATDCLKALNGKVTTHEITLAKQDTRIMSLEKFRDLAIRAVFSGLATGIGFAVTAGGILFGIGKAVGWW